MFDRFVPLSAVVCRERLWMTPMDSIIVIKTLLRKFLKKKKSLYLSRDSRADRHEIPKRDSIVIQCRVALT